MTTRFVVDRGPPFSWGVVCVRGLIQREGRDFDFTDFREPPLVFAPDVIKRPEDVIHGSSTSMGHDTRSFMDVSFCEEAR